MYFTSFWQSCDTAPELFCSRLWCGLDLSSVLPWSSSLCRCRLRQPWFPALGLGSKVQLLCGEVKKPSEAFGFKLVFLICLSLGIQSRVCMLVLRQAVCVASVSSVVAARASLPPVCQKRDAASSVSPVWLLKKPSTEQQTS